jgi:TatD DNase family protein
MFTDFHTHLSSYEKPDEIIDEIIENQIVSIACSMDIMSYQATKRLSEKTALIVPTFGIHPMCSDAIHQFSMIDIYLDESRIIGEIGLDDYWVKDISLVTQEKVFEYILDHCDRYHKYCVIHTKGVEKHIEDILGNYKNANPIIHWYSGPREVHKKYIDRQYYFTFGCEVRYSEDIRDLLKATPLDLILAETDNPTAEKWLGGSEDRPILIKRVIEDIAKVKEKSFEEINKVINENSRKIMMESGINFPIPS